MQSTIAWISARGVKYCPAPDLMSSAPLLSSSSYASPLMSTPAADQFSLSIRSTMRRLSLAGSWMRFCALRKIDAERAGLAGELLQDVPVGDLQLVAVGVEQPLPRALRRHDPLGLERPGLPLVRHLEEQQVRQLLGVLDRRDPVVAQHVAVRPQLVDEATGMSQRSDSSTRSVCRVVSRPAKAATSRFRRSASERTRFSSRARSKR